MRVQSHSRKSTLEIAQLPGRDNHTSQLTMGERFMERTWRQLLELSAESTTGLTDTGMSLDN